MSVILTPIVLCFSLPQCSYDILHFIRDHSKYVDGVGAICDYSLMELDVYGDEEFGTVIDSGRVNDHERPYDGKLEQSYLSFQQQHPTWAGNPAGRNLINKIHEYKQHVEETRQSMISSALYQSMNLLRSQHAPPPTHHLHPFSPNGSSGSDHGAHSADVKIANQQDSVPHLDIPNQQSSQPSCDIPTFAQNSQSLAAASAFLFSAMGSVQDSAMDNMPSVLRSVLQKENIDYQNDFYWLTKVSSLTPSLSHCLYSSSGIVSPIPFPPSRLLFFNPHLTLPWRLPKVRVEDPEVLFLPTTLAEGIQSIVGHSLPGPAIPTRPRTLFCLLTRTTHTLKMTTRSITTPLLALSPRRMWVWSMFRSLSPLYSLCG